MWSKGRSHAEKPSVPEAWPGRPLVGAERAFFTISRVSPLNLVVLIHLTGPNPSDLLPKSLAALQNRHPLLRATITGRPSRPRFDVRPAYASAGPGPIPLRLISGSERTLAVIEDELNLRFDAGRGPLARMALVSDGGPDHDLVLTLHHSIADGAAAGVLVHELLDLCAAGLVDTEPRTPGPARPPQPLTAGLPAELRGPRMFRSTVAYVARQAADEVSYRRGSRGLRRPVPPPRRALTTPLNLDRNGTTALVDRARRNRLTLTSLLGAALLKQASAVLYQDRPAAMRVVIWVDLRRYLDPPVPDDVLGCYASMFRFVVRVEPTAGLDVLASQVQSEIGKASQRGDRIPAALLSPALTRMAVRFPVGRLGTIALSYAPAPAVRSSYGSFAVRDVRAFVSNVRLGADLAAACGVSGGRLWCDLLYQDGDIGTRQADAVSAGLMSALAEFAQVESGR